MATVSSHEINLHGLSGSVLWTVLVGFIFYVLGFATVGWRFDGSRWTGLWLTCVAQSDIGVSNSLKATQAMITIGLIFFVAACICIIMYMFIHSLSFNKNILIQVFTGFCFAAVLFILIGVAVFGGEYKTGLNWSYAFAIIGGIFCLLSGILSLIHMRKSGVI